MSRTTKHKAGADSFLDGLNARAGKLSQLPEYVRGHRLATLGGKDESGDHLDGDAILSSDEDELADAQVVTSWTGDREPVKDGKDTIWEELINLPETFHRPVLDIDFPVHVIPSTTPGHGHLYMDKVLTWSQYVEVLEVLGRVGILEPGYVQASIAREFTSVRLPWVKKPASPECDGSGSCRAADHIEGCFSTNPDFATTETEK